MNHSDFSSLALLPTWSFSIYSVAQRLSDDESAGVASSRYRGQPVRRPTAPERPPGSRYGVMTPSWHHCHRCSVNLSGLPSLSQQPKPNPTVRDPTEMAIPNLSVRMNRSVTTNPLALPYPSATPSQLAWPSLLGSLNRWETGLPYRSATRNR